MASCLFPDPFLPTKVKHILGTDEMGWGVGGGGLTFTTAPRRRVCHEKKARLRFLLPRLAGSKLRHETSSHKLNDLSSQAGHAPASGLGARNREDGDRDGDWGGRAPSCLGPSTRLQTTGAAWKHSPARSDLLISPQRLDICILNSNLPATRPRPRI